MPEQREAARPNILVILSDDQGPWALGCAGNDEIVTPNLDALAAHGTRFTNFHCTSPVCSPARASLLTGRMPSAHGVHDWIRPPAGVVSDPYLAGQETTVEQLADAGWTCGIVGKWHLGGGPRPAPGFSHWNVHALGGGPYHGAPMWRDGRLYREPRYLTDAITDGAVDFLRRQSTRQPFSLSVHYTAPHSPWLGQHPAEDEALYADCDFASAPQGPRHEWWAARGKAVEQAFADPRPSLIGYYASITAMDRDIGRILQTLRDEGVERDTLVVFLSDNGFSCGQRGFWGKGNGTDPLNMFAECVTVPAIVAWPGHVRSGAVCEELVSGYDLHPTLLDLAGIASEDDPLAPGRSLRPLLTGEGILDRDMVGVVDEYGPVRMINTGRYKYVERNAGPAELYDLQEDPGERTNRVADRTCAGEVSELRAGLRDFFAACSDAPLDGWDLPVTGWGQRSPLATRDRTASAFWQGAEQQ